MSVLERMKAVVVERILGVSDTPHRIAWGVALGFLIAWTPTLGIQIALYVALATVLRANKVAGIPILFVMNPATMLPVCFLNFRIGTYVLHGGASVASANATDAAAGVSGNLWEIAFWRAALEKLVSMGGEIWIGALVLGLLTGVPAYFATRRAIRLHRERNPGSLQPAPSHAVD